MNLNFLPPIASLIVLSLSSSGQDAAQAPTKPKEISAKDKAAVIEIFKPFDDHLSSTYYYLEFRNNETYGLGNPGANTLAAMKTGRFSSPSLLYRWYAEIGVLYVIWRPPTTSLEAIFGKENALKLKTIFAKYSVGAR